jgi:CHAT domain-containing protein
MSRSARGFGDCPWVGWEAPVLICLFAAVTAGPRGTLAEDSAAALREQARTACRQERYADAARAAERAVEIDQKQQGAEHHDTAASLNVLSEAYLGLGQYQRALDAAERALAIRESVRGPEHLETAESLNDVGVLYLHLRQPDRAADAITRALAIRKRQLPAGDLRIAESESNWAAVLSTRGAAAAATGNRQEAAAALTEAAESFERALKIKDATLGSNDPSTCGTVSSLAATYLRLSQLASAEDQVRLNRKAEDLGIKATACASGTDQVQTLPGATAKINAAWARWKQNVDLNARSIVVLDEMRDLFQQAAATREQILGPGHPDTAQAWVMLATTAQAVGNYRQALELLRKALATEDRLLATLVAVGDEQQRLELLRQAEGHYMAALSMIQRRLPKDPEAVRLGLELVLRRKGIILDVQTRIRESLAHDLDKSAVDTWNRLVERRTELSRLLLQGPGADPSGYRKKIEALSGEIEQEERALGKQSPVIAEELAQRDVTAAAVAKQLPKDAVLVEYVRIRDWDDQGLRWAKTSRYLAFVLTPENEVTLVDLGEADGIDKALREGFAAIEDPKAFADPVANQKKTDAALGKLYGRLIEPLGTPLRTHTSWIISPDGEINKAPFPALRTPAGTYVVEDRLLTLVTSGRDLLRGQPAQSPQLGMLMVANPKFDSAQTSTTSANRRRRRDGAELSEQSRGRFRYQFGALPGTAAEAKAIQPLIQGSAKVLEDEQATEPAVWDVILDTPPRVLHFATHGVFEGGLPMEPADPEGRAAGAGRTGRPDDLLMRSFLALAGVNRVREILPNADDGVLYAAEVAEMDLHGTELVVLSACQTALGDVRTGEGVYGLRRAFVLAGARNLIMSLWPVDDDETRNLMEHFYRNYSSGTPAPEALRQAQISTLRSLRAGQKSADGGQSVAPVVLWAPFVVQQSGR